jgi:PAS domain S-box-containing protein
MAVQPEKLMPLQKTENKAVSDHLKHVWLGYKGVVENATKSDAEIGSEDIAYWRNRLFTTFITWLMPVSIVPLLPGVIMGIKEGYPFIAAVDLLAAISLFTVALYPGLNLALRKFLVVVIMYCLAAFLMVYLGLLGPGFIYLLALSVFITLTCPVRYAYYSVATNFVICLCCGLIIYFKLFDSPLIKEFSLGIWTAVSSNLIFLSLVCVVLIISIINNLEDTVIKEFRLKNQLQKESIERLRNNELLKESEGHYRSLFFRSPSPMWVLDSISLRFLQVNEAAVKTYGYSDEEFLSMTIDDIKADEDSIDFLESQQGHNKRGASRTKIMQHHRKNGENFYVEVRFNSIPFRGKKATLGIARDMSEQMKYIKAIENQNKKLHEIAYIQSHLVRAPLARIIALVDLMSINTDKEAAPEILSYLDQSAKEFDEIIKTITSKTEQIETDF